jgi:transcriptional regulator with XRE-family HTH domain
MAKKEIDERFMQAVNAVCAKLNMSYAAISKDISTNSQYVSKINTGGQSANLDSIDKLCNKYNVSKSYILEGTGDIFKKDIPKPPPPDKEDPLIDKLKKENKELTQEIILLQKQMIELLKSKL